jgi:hypothetical protein
MNRTGRGILVTGVIIMWLAFTPTGFRSLLATELQNLKPDKDPVTMLKARIKENTNAIEQLKARVYYNKYGYEQGGKGWAKQKAKLVDLEYDVKKTDSLVTPYIGIVQFSLVLEQSPFYASEDEAVKSVELDSGVTLKSPKCRVTYAFQEDQWIAKRYERLSWLNDKWEDVDITERPRADWDLFRSALIYFK